MKVLLIDNKPVIRKELQNIIPWSQYGFSKFMEADNGADGLRLIDSVNPELILLDIRLRDMSGMALIHEIKKNKYTGKIIIVSKDTSFANARLAINYGVTAYLNKPVEPEELTEAVIRAVNEIHKSKLISFYSEQATMLPQNYLLSNILLGNMTYVKEMKSIYHIELKSDYYRLVSFILPQKPDNCDIWTDALQLTGNCLSVTFSETRLVLIAQSSGQEQFILRQLKTCHENYPQYSTLLGIVSRLTKTHTELNALYTESQHIIQNLYYYKRKQDLAIHADALSKRLEEIQQNDCDLISFTENIIRRILLLQSAELESDLLSLLDFLASRRPPEDSARFILLNHYAQIVSVLTEYYPKLEFEIPDRKAFASHLSYDKYLCDSIAYLNDQFQKAIAYIRNESRKKPCQRICQYIDTNYSAPLKLSGIADLLGYNSAYLGKLFFREMGINFNTYLDKVRIKKAAEYLEKGVSVIQTSEFAGFTNPDYFTKKFKKYMGILPSEYRAQHINKQHTRFTPPHPPDGT